jgi:hypothetical protein
MSEKNEIKPWLSEFFCIPPEADAEFVAAMEDVLDVYERPYDEARPVVCLDETSKEVHGDVTPPISARPPMEDKPATPKRHDYEYVRNGTASIFALYEPKIGRAYTEVSEQRTALDYARVIKHLCDELYPDAEKIVLVQDNLNTHTIASLYKAFAPQEAHRLAQRLEIHYTPKHGSWLNAAEILLRVLTKQCISARFPTLEALRNVVQTWQQRYDRSPSKTDWQFTTRDARPKLKRLYPKIQEPRY